MLIFFRAKVSLFGSDEILLNYASILRDERNYTMVSCLGRKNRAGGECFGERDRGREGGVGEIWKRESVPHFSRLDPPSCLLRVWDIFLFLSLSLERAMIRVTNISTESCTVSVTVEIYGICYWRSYHSHPKTAIKIKHSEAGVDHK